MVLFNAKFIEGFVKRKTMKNQRLLAEKYHFFHEYSKFRDVGPNAKGQFRPIFKVEIRKLRKLTNTYRILVKMVLFKAEFIEGFVKRKTMKNQRLLAEKYHFFHEYSKFSDCLLYTSPSPRDQRGSRMPSSA